MKIFDVIENKTILIPKELILNKNVFDIIKNAQKQPYFNASLKSGGLEIIAGNYIGIIPINKEIALNIHPKIKISNLFYLLKTAKRELRFLSNFFRSYTQDTFNIDLVDLFTIYFLKNLETIEREGVFRDYVIRIENSSTPKGKILFKDHLHQNVFKNIHHRVTHSYQELSRDILPNQVIKYTIEYLTQYHRIFNKKNKHILKRLEYYRNMFSRVSYKNTVREMNQIEIQKLFMSIPSIRSYYQDTLKVCFLILQKANFSFEKKEISDIHALPSIYINMEDIFEQYLLNSLNSTVTTEDIYFYKGHKHLFSDKRHPSIEPDIILEKNKRISCLADAKYKDNKPTRDDIFQMISYLVSYNCKIGVFILPLNKNKRVEYLGEISGKIIYIYRININNENISDCHLEEEALFNFLKMDETEKKNLVNTEF
ncbi:hypothetical protein P5815_09975 [Bacillus cereus]|uniref:5-methylcytosine restriction system specificity protein McrC n=2 Tax=Bacillaceae TaxID=186817 RepID=UPI0018F32E83|nr:hypothetical protein [Bacillus cereus]MBJ7952443.1 hypothetical protein [Bacillus cereus]MBT0791177.1 hypothetical protein [Bacillus cereus]MBX9154349.1 hypothetical protein [Bacillus cereus]MDF9520877.1 hypothetical protein [Bacillus cereus]MDF9563702.1 hypothetical protein [Bacillus cereus]